MLCHTLTLIPETVRHTKRTIGGHDALVAHMCKPQQFPQYVLLQSSTCSACTLRIMLSSCLINRKLLIALSQIIERHNLVLIPAAPTDDLHYGLRQAALQHRLGQEAVHARRQALVSIPVACICSHGYDGDAVLLPPDSLHVAQQHVTCMLCCMAHPGITIQRALVPAQMTLTVAVL